MSLLMLMSVKVEWGGMGVEVDGRGKTRGGRCERIRLTLE